MNEAVAAGGSREPALIASLLRDAADKGDRAVLEPALAWACRIGASTYDAATREKIELVQALGEAMRQPSPRVPEQSAAVRRLLDHLARELLVSR